ncbi:MAG: hypothetical protein ACRCZF_16500 [Gemmataceae bacterium]
MLRCFIVLLMVAGPAFAQAPAPTTYRFVKDEEHKFQVRHETTVAETVQENLKEQPRTSTTTTKVTLTRIWKVLEVDAAGTANLQLRIVALKQEHTKPDGEALVLDSATAEGAAAMGEYLNKPIVTVKMAATGEVMETNAEQPAMTEAAKRLRLEVPFRVVWPGTALAGGAKWARPVTIVLDPPAGAGEKVEAKQEYHVQELTDRLAKIELRTDLANTPTQAADWQPLVGFLWQGTVQFDRTAQQYIGCQLKATKELPLHRGVGSKFVYQSVYTEERLK